MNSLMRGIQPFWFWNGDMDDTELCRQIGEMKEQGLKGFLIHPRQGMEIPYLSEIYFEKVKLAVAEAKKHNMEVWLYDEFPYPSGISGGKVTLEHPEYSCTELTKTCQVYQGGETAKLYAPWGKLLSARAYRMVEGRCQWEDLIDLTEYVGCGYLQDVFQMSGLTEYNKKRYFQGELSQYLFWRVPEGSWKVYIYTEVVMKHFKYFENFIDPLNPQAVQCFLQTTHEKYKIYVGEEFGKTIRGVFTDEVTAFPPFHPWSVLLPDLVKNMSDLALLDHLPALTEDMGEVTDRIRYAYWNAATEQFINSWDKQVYEWCEQNHLLYIGEKPILRSKELAYTHVPGIDAGHQKFGSHAVLAGGKYRANGKIVSSAAHFYRKPAALCEVFHSIGWGMTLQDAKWIFDWLAVMGIDWFITHGAYYTTDALKKHDAPPSFFYQMPWWENTHKLSAYVDRLINFLSEGTRHVSVLLLDPITSTWTEIEQRLKRLNLDFAAFQNELLRVGVDYYIMDPQLFEKGEIHNRGGRICYENCGDSYEVLVLPFMTNLESGAVKKVQEFVDGGGLLLAAGTLPYRELEEYQYGAWVKSKFGSNPSAISEAYFSGMEQMNGQWYENCYFSPSYHDVVRELCHIEERKKPWKIFQSKDGGILQIQSLGIDGKEKLFLTNMNAKNQRVGISMGDFLLYRDLVGGESVFMDEEMISTLVKEQRSQFECGIIEGPKDIILEIDTTEEMSMHPISYNALRIAKWQIELADGQEAEVDSYPIIDQMEAANLKIDIHQKNYFGCSKELEFPKIDAVYTYDFISKIKFEENIYLVMEPGTLLGHWFLEINGKEYRAENFVSQSIYMHSNLAVNITSDLRLGKNSLKLHIESENSFGGIRNPIYLCGKFSVFLEREGAVLKPMNSKGAISNLTGCGLPYYAGTVEFFNELPVEWGMGENSDSMVHIRMKNQDFHESLQLKLGHKLVDICAFAPYEFIVPLKELQRFGEFTLCLNTSLSRLFEGEYFDELEHRYVKIQ